MCRWFLVVALAACGPHRNADSTLVIEDPPTTASADAAAPTPTATTAKPATKPAITAQLTIEEACARFDALADEGCDWTQRFPPAFREPAACAGSLTTWMADPNLQKVVACWALECGPATQCMTALAAAKAPAPERTCGEEGTGPVIVDAATWAARPGANAKKFSEVKSSQDKPIEVCGIEGEVAWITTVRCNDGSNPYGSQAVANESRDAWIQRGGRCNSVLDRYSVKCPEATYEVYVDRYVCPKK